MLSADLKQSRARRVSPEREVRDEGGCPEPLLFMWLRQKSKTPDRLRVKCQRGNEPKPKQTPSQTASSSPPALSALVHPAKATRGFPCTLYYSPPVSTFLFAHPSGSNVCKKKTKKKGKATVLDLVVAAAAEGDAEIASSLAAPDPEPLSPPLGRASVCLCAQGFDTAIQVLLLPWCWMPYKASGVKEH